MPSKYSPASKSDEYEDEAKKMLQTKNNRTINALIRGMTDEERVDKWVQVEANGRCRKKIIGRLNRKKMELE